MKKEQKLILNTLVAIVLLFVVGSVVYNKYQSNDASSNVEALLMKDYAMKLGPDDAKVKLVEFFDPACGTCAQFYPFVKQIMKKHEGDIQLILRYAPFHQNSEEVVKIIEAAREQNLFWESLEFFFSTQQYWVEHHVVNKETVWKLLENFWIDVDKLKQDVKSDKIAQRIEQDLKDVNSLNIKQTPSYYVNGKPLEKFGYQELLDLIEGELK